MTRAWDEVRVKGIMVDEVMMINNIINIILYYFPSFFTTWIKFLFQILQKHSNLNLLIISTVNPSPKTSQNAIVSPAKLKQAIVPSNPTPTKEF